MNIPLLSPDQAVKPEFLWLLWAVMMTANGLVMMFFGYRLYRLFATLQGIAVGAVAAAALSMRYLPDVHLLHYFLGLVGAGLGGALFFHVSVFLMGAFLGAVIVHLLNLAWLASQGMLMELSVTKMMVSYVIAAIAGGALTLAFRRPLLILITSLGGAAMALMGAAVAGGGFDQLQRMHLLHWILAAVAFAALSTVAVIVQWKTSDAPLDVFGGPSENKKSAKKPAKKPAGAET